MLRFACLWLLLSASAGAQVAAPHHDPDFDAKHARADDLFAHGKSVDALPLYQDLARQDPAVGVFAERIAAGLFAQSDAATDATQKLNLRVSATRELKRAWALGDHSEYVRVHLIAEDHTLVGSVLSGVPLTPGYTYHGKADAQPIFQQAESTFSRGDFATAANLFAQAATADPSWYDAALFAGDSFFRLNDAASAGPWFAKAIAIDPDRETAYRYWGDALFHAGDRAGARDKFIQAVVAEPYGVAAINELRQWASRTGNVIATPAVRIPEFTTDHGELRVDGNLQASRADGRFAWIAYQKYRVAHGALTLQQPVVAGASDKDGVLTPSGYRHTIAEEHAALRAMLAEVEAGLQTGELTEAALDPNIRNIRNLEKSNFLGAWIALNFADAGIRSDYAQFRSHHRKHLAEYVVSVCIRPAPANAAPKAGTANGQ